MWNHVLSRISLRASIVWSLALALMLSLMCSISLQKGHADVPVAASADEIQPLRVGQDAPRFIVRTIADEPYDFDPGNLERPAIVIAFRGGWCPFCNMHLNELRTVMPEILDLGIDVIFLSGDRPDLLYVNQSDGRGTDMSELGYEIYSDADAQAAIALGIAFRASDHTIERRHEKGQDIAESSMLRHGILPVPAVFAIGADGVIEFAFTEPNYKIRLPAEELLAVAREIMQ